jgi:hypothetical protein
MAHLRRVAVCGAVVLAVLGPNCTTSSSAPAEDGSGVCGVGQTCGPACTCASGLECVASVCVIPGPKIGFSPSYLDFGTAPLNRGTTLPLQIKNVGTAELHILGLSVDSASSDLRSDPAGPVDQRVAPGEAWTINVVLTPSDGEPDQGHLCVSYEGATALGCVLLVSAVSGDGKLCAVDTESQDTSCQTDGATLDFGSAVALGTDAQRIIAFHNDGDTNQSLVVENARDFFITTDPVSDDDPYRLEELIYTDEALSASAEFPLSLYPEIVESEDNAAVAANIVYVRVTFKPKLPGVVQRELCVEHESGSLRQTICYTLSGTGAGCPEGYWTRPGENACACRIETEVCDYEDNDCDGSVDEVADTDKDGDNYSGCPIHGAQWDCEDDSTNNPNAATIRPNAVEECDGIDNNCNGDADEGLTRLYYRDHDGDFHGVLGSRLEACPGTLGDEWMHEDDPALLSVDDCNDIVATINPLAAELCNKADDNCNDIVDDGWSDYCECIPTETPETLCDGQDNDCDRLIDNVDNDEDGYYPCASAVNWDCDDDDPDRNPAAQELCDYENHEENCNGVTNEGVTVVYYLDNDEDEYGTDSAQLQGCADNPPTDHHIRQGGDCNDFNNAIKPGTLETCNDLDDDCNGTVDDESSALPYVSVYVDLDGDGYGTAAGAVFNTCLRNDSNGDGALDPPLGFSVTNEDCNDTNSTVYPRAPELCDGILNNCGLGVPDVTCPTLCNGFPITVGTSAYFVLPRQLDDDNDLEILVSTPLGVMVINPDGSEAWRSTDVALTLTTPTVADLDFDGRMEVVLGYQGFIWVLADRLAPTGVGEVLAKYAVRNQLGAFGRVHVFDLDNDGGLELVVPGFSQTATVVHIGAAFAEEDSITLTVPNSEAMGGTLPLLADLDEDGLSEISLGTGIYYCTRGVDCNFRLHVFDAEGSEVFDPESTFSLPDRDSAFSGDGLSALVADLDGDGVAEVANRLGIKSDTGTTYPTYLWTLSGEPHPTHPTWPPESGSGEFVGLAIPYAPVALDGTVTTGRIHSQAGPVVDLDGDGDFEFIQGGYSSGYEGRLVVSAESDLTRSPTALPGYPIGPRDIDVPVVQDLDGDDRLEILFMSRTDYRLHCVRLGQGTGNLSRIASLGAQGWSEGAFETSNYDPFEPNNPFPVSADRTVDPALHTASTARAALRAFPIVGLMSRSHLARGKGAQLFGVLGTKYDRDYYWFESYSDAIFVDLILPDWAPADYDLAIHYYDATTGAYLSKNEAKSAGGEAVYCDGQPLTGCPPDESRVSALIEIMPHDPEVDFGPWPYRLEVYGSAYCGNDRCESWRGETNVTCSEDCP